MPQTTTVPDWAYVEKPVIKGVIKASPDDFRVEEVLGFDLVLFFDYLFYFQFLKNLEFILLFDDLYLELLFFFLFIFLQMISGIEF